MTGRLTRILDEYKCLDTGGQKTREVLLQMIADAPSVTTTQMASALGINRSAVSKHLDRLKADGRLRRVGPDKGGHWKLLM